MDLVTIYAKAKTLADEEFGAKDSISDFSDNYNRGYAWTLIYSAEFVKFIRELSEEEDIQLTLEDIMYFLNKAIRSYTNPETDEAAGHALDEIKAIITYVVEMKIK